MKKIQISKLDLEELYLNQKLNTYQIATIFNCSQFCIFNKLKEFNIEKRTSLDVAKRDCNFSNLLLDIPETYYWIGFLLADGSFHKNRLKLTLSTKDEKHIKKYADFVECKNIIYGIKDKKYKYCAVICKDSKLVPKIKSKFDIQNRKTYNPPKINIQNKDLLISLLIGFIDGDGSIRHQKDRRDSSLRIKNHRSWLQFLEVYKLFFPNCKIKINNSGYAELTLTHGQDLFNLKKKAIELNLPILERKWNNIDMNYLLTRKRRKVSEESVL